MSPERTMCFRQWLRAQGPAQGAELIQEGGLPGGQCPSCGSDQEDRSRSEDGAGRRRDHIVIRFVSLELFQSSSRSSFSYCFQT